ncbi:AAA family ATPase [Motiliproteus sp. MSK22-1]|uniref:AAA family ATPase n=1 Tax=Motiliproteus sp. MSK22-1 TaxID=1897630 RepID=UPI000976FF88|nr:SMC family ATPase [Motiliproteus sp. MSK22-1]OMH38823.1 hypothetical protein BGP75_00125 [Motiliproteus sp. MSK22-1]
MRPISLTMTAFGPFPGKESIDFNRMGENPLFLINGPTGSGKTTILDAICFALYGKTTGDEREGSQMRADLATAGQLTEVTLVFELAGHYYRIRRVPEQLKPKARGEGVTHQSPEAQLWKLECSASSAEVNGVVLLQESEKEQLIVSSKVTEATREIENLTGLNADQFRQVMVLPQGKFRQLLMSDSKEREQIFSQLFQTHVYKQLEERLKFKASEIRQQVEKQRQRKQGLLEGTGVESEQELVKELEQLQPQLLLANADKERHQRQFQQAAEALQKANQLSKSFQALNSTRMEYQQLLSNSEQINAQRQQLERAEQAQKLSPEFTQWQRCQHEQSQIDEQCQLAEQRLQESLGRLQKAQVSLDNCPGLEQQLDGYKQQLALLQSYGARAEELNQAQQRFKQQQSGVDTLAQQQEKEQNALAASLADKERMERQHQQLQEQLLSLTDKQRSLDQLNEVIRIRVEFEKVISEQSKTQQRLQQAEVKGKQLKAGYEQQRNQTKMLEMRWHQGQAALLALELETGMPCPVCGSREHPDPTTDDQLTPSQHELDQARSQVEAAHQQLIDARESYQGMKKDYEHLCEKITQLQGRLTELQAPDISSTELIVQQSALEREVKTLFAQQQQAQQLLIELQQLKLTEADLRKQSDVTQKLQTEQQAQLAAAKSQLERAEAELPESYRLSGALEKAISQVQSEIADRQTNIEQIRQLFQQYSEQWHANEATLKSLQERKVQLQEKLAIASVTWEQVLAASLFDSELAFQQAQLDDTQILTLKQAITDFDRLSAELKGAVTQQEVSLKEQQPPDLEHYQQSLVAAEELKRASDAAWQALDRRITQLSDTEKKVQQYLAEQADLENHYRMVGTLSDVANGKTGNKISLQRFVLSVLLDDVLIEASRRLNLMSKGRYQLLRKEDRAKGNKASGLELEVEDAYTGKVRSVATLSGGESFMAALSMALGLSDVVQAYAGGIRLDTLFIDEGFGSLDPESLELAVRTLIDLQASGRMVGVISHVTELKEQMPVRLDVIADREGSRVKLVAP